MPPTAAVTGTLGALNAESDVLNINLDGLSSLILTGTWVGNVSVLLRFPGTQDWTTLPSPVFDENVARTQYHTEQVDAKLKMTAWTSGAASYRFSYQRRIV